MQNRSDFVLFLSSWSKQPNGLAQQSNYTFLEKLFKPNYLLFYCLFFLSNFISLLINLNFPIILNLFDPLIFKINSIFYFSLNYFFVQFF